MRRLIPFFASVLILLVVAGSAQAAFGVKEVSISYRNRDGSAARQAGSHPYAMDTTMVLNSSTRENGALYPEGGELRSLELSLPPGVIGNVAAIPQCTSVQFNTVDFVKETATSCPATSQVGLAGTLMLGTDERAFVGSVFNLAPPPGAVAALGFRVTTVPVVISFYVNPGSPYNLVAKVSNIQQEEITATFLEIWGEPTDPAHDPYRGSCLQVNSALPLGQFISRGDCPTSAGPPFLTLPRSCEEAGSISYRVEAWNGESDAGSDPAPSVGGCGRLGLAAATEVVPTSAASGSASGLDFGLEVEDPGLTAGGALAGSDVRGIEVAMPEGFVANPSLAEGLGACTEEDLARESAASPPVAGCPESSKIGTVEVETPVLSETLDGAIYAAQPYHNLAGDSLLGVYVVIKDPQLGVLIRQPVKITPDPATGRLVASSDSLPQLPFSHFRLHFRGGERGPLTTPPTCGSYGARAMLDPWSDGAQLESNSTFEITTGPAGTSCPNPGPSFSPSFEAGTVAPVAGTYSPFVLKLSRAPGTAQFRSIEASLPAGLLAKLKGVEECTDAEITAAAGRDQAGQGAREASSPSCPAASEVGSVTVGAGSGAPTYVKGRAYLAGPYKGAPLSLVVVTPAVTGPFDLGTVTVRNALYVDPLTARVRAVSDPLPSILQGIPLDIRSVSVDLDRPDFSLNPTSCQPSQVLGGVASLTDQFSRLSSRFQVGGCMGLKFKPDLKLTFAGQTKRTGFPAVRAVLTQPGGQVANLAGTSVILPKGMLIANAHINSPCTRVQFNADALPGEGCPAKSVLGSATVWTPLLEKPEQGKVYFRSNGGERQLPDLVVALRGQVPLELVGFIDSVGRKGAEVRRVRARFQGLPDAPVSRFEMKLAGGKKGLLQNSRSLCRRANVATVHLAGQNGSTLDTRPKVQVKCGHRDRPAKKRPAG